VSSSGGISKAAVAPKAWAKIARVSSGGGIK
jgi:hypothetical protein